MAGIIDKFKDLMGIPPEDEEQEEMDGEEELDTDDEPLDTDFYSDSDISSKHNKVVKVHATTQL